mgnify:CR=1 FL=1
MNGHDGNNSKVPCRKECQLENGIETGDSGFVSQRARCFRGISPALRVPGNFQTSQHGDAEVSGSTGGERWEEALSHCSARVQKGAKQCPTKKECFTKTLPLKRVLASHRFGYWSESHGKSSHFYGMFFRLTPRGQEPLVQWHWKMATTTKGIWEIDWEPVALDLEALIEKKNVNIAARQKRVEAALRELEPKLRGIKTHLTAVSDEFVIGKPMLFRVEFMNLGDAPIHYTEAGVGYYPLRVLNEKGEAIPCLKGPAQLRSRQESVGPRSTKILADDVDLNRDYHFSNPGTYFVQFDGEGLGIGEWIRTVDSLLLQDREFVSTTTAFPSNVLKIEIRGEKE